MQGNKIVSTGIERQRRPVTVLIADVVGSTALSERLGDEDTFLLMQRLYADWIAIIRQNKGTVKDFAGDGVMALFGAPISIEDAPLRACKAAIAIRDHIKALAQEIDAPGIGQPNVRIGIHCGHVILGPIESSDRVELAAVGETANVAARLEQEADPGTILVSEEIQTQLAGAAETVALGERLLRGRSRAQSIYRLESLKLDGARFDARLRQGLSPFVGRDREMSQLEERWTLAKDGKLEMAFIAGDAGIGKSRLAYEFRGRRRQESAALLQGHCLPDGSATAFLPFVEMIRRGFGISPESKTEQAAAKLREGLAELHLSEDGRLFILLNLLGYAVSATTPEIDPESIGIRTREILKEVLVARCRALPVLVIIEDVHWIDSASQELLKAIAESQQSLKLLVVCTCRPQYETAWVERAGGVVIELRALAYEPMTHLIGERLGPEQAADVIENLIEKSEGNPLFAEEMASHLLEHRPAGDKGQSGPELLPATLEMLLLQRVDELGEMSRRVVQIAAVFGYWFQPELIASVIGHEREIRHSLDELEARQLVLPESTNGERYRFKHALIRDAVYATLLIADRQKLHLSAGEAIERAFEDRTTEVADVLAQHFSRTNQTVKAIRYLAMAGEKSLRLYSIDEAYERFSQALSLLKTAPDLIDGNAAAEIVRNAARINFFRSDMFAAIGILEEFRSQLDRCDKSIRAYYLAELAHAYHYATQPEKVRSLLEAARSLAVEAQDERALGYSVLGELWRQVFWVEPVGTQRADIERLHREAVEIGRKHQDTWLMVTATFALALDAVMHGNPNEIRRRSDLLVALYGATGDRRAKALSLIVLAELDVFNSDYERAEERAKEAAPWLLTPIDQLNIACIFGMAAAIQGRGEEAYRILFDIRAKTVDRGVNLTALLIDPSIGVALVGSGQFARGIRFIEDTEHRFVRWNFPTGPAHCQMFLGEIFTRLALRMDKPPSWRVVVKNLPFLIRTMPFAAAKARKHLCRSIELYRRYDAPSYVAWSLLNLGLLDAARKRMVSARAAFDEARRFAERAEAFALLKRIDEAITATKLKVIGLEETTAPTVIR